MEKKLEILIQLLMYINCMDNDFPCPEEECADCPFNKNTKRAWEKWLSEKEKE